MLNNNLSPHNIQESKASPQPIHLKLPHLYQQNTNNLSSSRYFLINDGHDSHSPGSPSNFQSSTAHNMLSPATVELPSTYVLGTKKPPEPLIMMAKGQMTMSRR
jgi:hypothetical protein